MLLHYDTEVVLHGASSVNDVTMFVLSGTLNSTIPMSRCYPASLICSQFMVLYTQ